MHLVSIIMPNYNNQDFIGRAIESVLAQSYDNWELLITDDGSSDNSLDIIRSYKDERIKFFTNENKKGPAGARNTSINHATGRFIAFLDSDDQWLPCHLEERINHMLDNNHEFTYSWYDKIDETGNKIGKYYPKQTSTSYKKLLTNNLIGCLTAIYDTKNIGKVYMQDIKKRQDYVLWLDILKHIDRAYLYPKTTAIYTVRKDSVSSNKLKLFKYHWHIYRKIEGFNIVKSCFYFSIFLFKYIWKKLFT